MTSEQREKTRWFILRDKDGDEAGIEGDQLKVLAQISGTGSRYRPRLYQDVVDNSVAAGATETIFSYSGNGQYDFISLNLDKSKWEIILEIDSTEIYRLNTDMVDGRHKLTLPQDYIHIDKSNEFIEMYPTPVDFDTSMVLKVKNLETHAKYIRAVLVRYRIAM